MKLTSILSIVVIAGITSFGTYKAIDYISPSTVDLVEEKIQDFLENNPEAIKQALEKALRNEARLAQERQQSMIQETQAELLSDPDSPILGNKDGSIEMVLFIDPLCGFCRKFHPIVLDAIKKNKNLKVIVKDYPIIGGRNSMEIARYALAAKKQGKYEAFINQVYEQENFTEKALLAMAKKTKLNLAQFKKDLKDKELEKTVLKNIKLGRDLGIEGTPTFIIHKQLHAGFRDLETLMGIINQAKNS